MFKKTFLMEMLHVSWCLESACLGLKKCSKSIKNEIPRLEAPQFQIPLEETNISKCFFVFFLYFSFGPKKKHLLGNIFDFSLFFGKSTRIRGF